MRIPTKYRVLYLCCSFDIFNVAFPFLSFSYPLFLSRSEHSHFSLSLTAPPPQPLPPTSVFCSCCCNCLFPFCQSLFCSRCCLFSLSWWYWNVCKVAGKWKVSLKWKSFESSRFTIRLSRTTRSDPINCYGSCYTIRDFIGQLLYQLIKSGLVVRLSLIVDQGL